MLVAALTSYGGRAYGACVAGTPPNFTCSGANTTQQTITFDDAAVSTVPGFSVVTTNSHAVSITGDGALSYTDVNYSTLITSFNTALYVRSNGDVGGGNPGSVTINTNGALTGIEAFNKGSGALTITANGDLTGLYGIYARNYGTDLTVTTGVGTETTALVGIRTRNYGSGALTIIAQGDVIARAYSPGGFGVGIYARNFGTDLSVTTAAGTTVMGTYRGIVALNAGSGALTINSNGDVEGPRNIGILADNYHGTNLDITTAGVTGAAGIVAFNTGTGALTITSNGDVTGTYGPAIYARN